MGRHRNRATNVVISVDDSKDWRYDDGGWDHLDADASGEPSGGGDPADPPEPPPLGGDGSGESEWRAHAVALGLDVTNLDHRDEIVAAVKAAGHPVGDGTGTDGGDAGHELTPPPLGGPGSGVDAWRTYAAKLDVDTDGLKTRDEIVAAVKAAGHPVEASSQ